MPITTHDFAWLANLLGTDAVLSIMSGATNIELESSRAYVHDNNNHAPDGLYFSGAHWYCRRNEVWSNSYDLHYQQSGTAHLCQTFAAMIYADATDTLEANSFAANVQAAAQFLINLIQTNSDFSDQLLSELHSGAFRGESFQTEDHTTVQVDQLDQQELLQFLQRILDAGSAASIATFH